MKKVELEGRLYNAVTMDEYTQNRELYNPRFTAIESDNGLVMPIRSRVGDDGPGYYYQDGGCSLRNHTQGLLSYF